jgi:hypothetical protein
MQRKSLTPKSMHIKVNGNNVQNRNTNLAAIKRRHNKEIQFPYRKEKI